MTHHRASCMQSVSLNAWTWRIPMPLIAESCSTIVFRTSSGPIDGSQCSSVKSLKSQNARIASTGGAMGSKRDT